MDRLNALDWLMVLLVVLGGGAWLAAGLWQLNLVTLIFMEVEWLARAFMVVVGIAAHYMIYLAIKCNKAK